ncbi:coagulase/fibrinolysin precursor [bacterium BMS3Bbin14]|nr:coagulase/fibrinolysin precursor [bacterium BMS3Bbin14]
MKSKKILSATYFWSSVLAAVLAVSGAAPIFAAESVRMENQATVQINKNVIIVSGHVGAGYLSGESTESVYNAASSGYKLSELTWRLRDVFMFNAGVSVQPTTWLKLHGDIWVKVNDGNGSMDDYDWFVEGWDWTHWSHHNNVELSEGLMYDLNAEFPFYRFDKTTFSALIGYKHDHWEWKARGGSYIYSTYALRDTVGTFPDNELVITYEQTFGVPYVGLAFDARLEKVTLTGRLIGSTLVKVEDVDHHHLRNLLIENDFDTGSMVSFDLGGSYNFTDQFSLLAAYHYQIYYETKGSTKITDLLTGETQNFPGDAMGTDHQSNMISLSLRYTF